MALLEVENLVKHFPVTRGIIMRHQIGTVKAVDGVSFSVDRGQTVALVGESGCGESTTARAVLQLLPPTAGSIRFEGEELTKADTDRLRVGWAQPVSALDVSIQAQVLNLLEDIQDRLGLAYLFIAHDLSVVRHIADRVCVMYLGAIVEEAATDDVFESPSHPYTQALISAVPVADPRKERVRTPILLTGDVPSPLDPPSGCRFRTRCPKFADDLTEEERRRCVDEPPALVDHGTGHPAACHYAEVVTVL